MSLPTSQSAGVGSARRIRAPSVTSHSSPRLIPGSFEVSGDGPSPSPTNDDSFPGQPDTQASPLVFARNAATAAGHREPTRSSIHLSYRAAPPSHLDNTCTARSVREDTAELASYALSDRASGRSVSPPRQRPAQTSLESYFNINTDEDSSPVRNAEGLHEHIIEEVSEPVSPESSSSSTKAPGASALTDMLKRSPPHTPPKSCEADGDETEESDRNWNEEAPRQRQLIMTANGEESDPTERTSLLGKDTRFVTHHPDWTRGEQDIESRETKRKPSWPRLRNVVLWPREKGLDVARTVVDPRMWDRKAIWRHAVKEPVGALPAVIVGVLLNILDALSYGMILFPLGQPVFEKLGAAGISMFYVSCIVSQFVYSCGGSKFKGGVGSEMIEVVPFFHKMAFTILKIVGEDNPDSVIATTIVAYALSSILTGLVFFLMGSFNFGYIVGFIPRHILIGCIGGVGVFLLMTGLEVCAGLSDNLNFDLATLKKLIELETLEMWIIPLTLAITVFLLTPRIKSKLFLPIFILCIPAVFYFFVLSTDQLDPEHLRKGGWIFEGPAAGEPWWYFYTLYNFKLVHWGAILETVPSMFALTFFGILHVPINVPSLGFRLDIDDIDLDRELMAHGVSNALSGFAGSIQNYLVYSNSVLFINSGGNSRLAGIMLAICTAAVMAVGPVIIGYIPTMMVGTLIFVLGLELTQEAIWEPRKKLKTLEYCTVVVIVVVMGVYDFVVGIAVGVGLAFISLVFQTSTVPAVRASYSGEVAGSTVRRNPTQYRYLRDVGQQIHVTKLAGYLFFGTIVSVEDRIRGLIEAEAFHQRPIRFLVFDLTHVTGIDYSAAEAFNRLSRLLGLKSITLLMSGVRDESEIGQGLRATGVGDGVNEVKMFEDLNSALESCENELLKTLYASKDARANRITITPHLDAPGRPRSASHTFDTQFSSPRLNQLQRAATTTLDDALGESRYLNFKEPLRLILQTFQGLTDKNEDFWFQSLPFFVRKEYPAGTILFERGEQAKGFYLLEDGILRADYELPQGRYFESIVAGTTCGELPFFSETVRTATVQAERDCVTWLMDRDSWDKLRKTEHAVAQELLRISLKLTSERMSAITSYVLTTAG